MSRKSDFYSKKIRVEGCGSLFFLKLLRLSAEVIDFLLDYS
ncbi:hypothetical protein [Leptospira santarosai]|uniref:Uncharacterized protein n=1 Tax=Leptospira santarosai str. CBC1416 TaxID=1193059 RepID=M6VWL5_9LEPT|nr:hypothetical protein [Leptospira santarosai]EMO57409.1 hypothetical protein LEP1GSC161_1060 [Leptospira santarosai str. CBC1416]EKR91815.1 hypothetical protein LEP1GSC163_2955 [Leptospira santarosai str. CBC379]EMJ47774.1 hypothetical protein LEP1GSC169_3544 [Leptospira santarosai str. HAI1349]EMO12584.1 hypothetical protein LEP1GSC165_3787 [Leptospira santarosai str. CBC523]EMP01075.1 hypothetical protein LEP1GSC171_3868 [Leptospira santarosai str. HAI1380]